MKNLKDLIYNLENSLLKSDTRSSKDKIYKLLSEDFIEYCSSGTIYKYKPGDTFSSNNIKLNWDIKDFSITKLTDDCCLARYILIKNNEQDTLRSSIWKKIDSKWSMIFHQGTIVSK